MSKFKIILVSALFGIAATSVAASASATVYTLMPKEPGTITGTETVDGPGMDSFAFTVDSPYTFSFEATSGVFEFPIYSAGTAPGAYTVDFTATGPGTIGYTLTTAGVPEPATWAMMLAGVGGIGAAMRRRPVKARIGKASVGKTSIAALA
jgi:hypothetical protein